MGRNLVFLKLGGSLITVKNKPHTPRLDILERLAKEIQQARTENPDLHILLGHGSGSFGHVPASMYKTRAGVHSQEEWSGFVEVWRQAAELNHLVLQALEKAGLPAIAFPPLAMVTSRDGEVETWDIHPLQAALSQGLLPVIYGDTVFDSARGGTILSTEDEFAYLAILLQPDWLLFAGQEAGVWTDFPETKNLLPEITPSSFPGIAPNLGGSAATDVTGGMMDKVQQVMALIERLPGLQGMIFTGETPGNVYRALCGERVGTALHGL